MEGGIEEGGGGRRGRGSEIISLLISQVVGKKRQASFCKHRLGPQSCGRHATRIANIQYIYTHTLKITRFEAVCLTIKIIFQIINEVNALFTLSIIPTHLLHSFFFFCCYRIRNLNFLFPFPYSQRWEGEKREGKK